MNPGNGLVETVVQRIVRAMDSQRLVIAGVSNRHLHLSREHADRLFGPGYEPEKYRDLRQPGQYACKETVTIATHDGCLEKVRLLGPIRAETQVELSASDARRLGLELPLMKSGLGVETQGVVLIGPRGSATCSRGVGVAWRHLHLSTAEGEIFGLSDGDETDVETTGDRSVVFRRVWVRVGETMLSEFHVDTDEANAAGLSTGDRVRVL